MSQSIDLSRWELQFIESVRELLAMRTDSISFIWTEVEELGGAFLNLLAPKNSLFWNFRRYRNFDAGHAGVTKGVSSKDDAKPKLLSLVADAGHEPKSYFAAEFLRALTSRFGQTFRCDEIDDGVFLAAERHDCIWVPDDSVEMVKSYFSVQLKALASSLTISCPEGVSVVSTSDLEPTPFDSLRHQLSFSVMNSATLATVREGVHSLAEQVQTWTVGKEIPYFYGVRGGVHLTLLQPLSQDTNMEAFAIIAASRAEFIASKCSLRVIADARRELDTLGWSDPRLIDLRLALMTRLDSEICKHPIIGIDPFLGALCQAFQPDPDSQPSIFLN